MKNGKGKVYINHDYFPENYGGIVTSSDRSINSVMTDLLFANPSKMDRRLEAVVLTKKTKKKIALLWAIKKDISSVDEMEKFENFLKNSKAINENILKKAGIL